MTTTPLAIVAPLSLPFLFVLIRRPVLRRLALRNAVRRPREAALVVVGSLLGAAIITGSFVVGDTMDASIRQTAGTHLGPVDELVAADGRGGQRRLLDALEPAVGGEIDGILGLATLDVAVTSTGPHVLAAPRAQVVAVDFDEARRFGGDPGATGISGSNPELGTAAVGSDLARALRLTPGSRIAVHVSGVRSLLLVDRILPRRGIAGFWLGAEPEANNVLVSPATLELLRARVHDRVLPSWAVAVSNRGGVLGGADRTDAAVRQIEQALAGYGPDPQIDPVKQRTVEVAETVGEGFTSMFTAMGSFGVLAGLLLLVNLFVMLAAERKTELGMARAVGLRRAELVGAFATEGWLYALAATVLGVLTGIGLGAVLVALSARIFSSEHSRFEMSLTIEPGSLASSFAAGFAVALLTIVGTSMRVSRLNIIRAIRDLPEPPRQGRGLRWLVGGGVAAAAGLVLTVSGASSRNGFALLLGPMLMLLGLTPFAGRLLPRQTVDSVAALAAVVWGATLFAVVPSSTNGAGVMLYVVQGVVLTTAAVILISLQQERLSRILRRLTGGRSLSLRLGLAYPLARRSRTGLTIAMYALVVFILTFMTTLAHMIDSEVETATQRVQGGYSVVVSSSAGNPVDVEQVAALDGVTKVAPLARTPGLFRVEGMSTDALWNLSGFDARFVRGGPPELEDRGRYATDREAWEAVLRDPDLIIVDPAFLQAGGGPAEFVAEPGTKVRVKDPYTGQARVVTVAALAPSDYFIQNGAFYGLEGARSLIGFPLAFDHLYVGLRPGVDADAFATDVQAAFLRNGAEAVSIEAIMEEGFTMTRQIFQLFQGYLAMGLIVGIAGTAVVMVRAVRERRRQIGTLRAIGFGARPVGRSFAIETGFVAVEGTVIGTVLALVTLYDIVAMSDSFGEMRFSIPFAPLTLLLLGTVAASLIATIWPTVSASRIRPAVALRMTD
jgi:putative ABC transport system permease protein